MHLCRDGCVDVTTVICSIIVITHRIMPCHMTSLNQLDILYNCMMHNYQKVRRSFQHHLWAYLPPNSLLLHTCLSVIAKKLHHNHIGVISDLHAANSIVLAQDTCNSSNLLNSKRARREVMSHHETQHQEALSIQVMSDSKTSSETSPFDKLKRVHSL